VASSRIKRSAGFAILGIAVVYGLDYASLQLGIPQRDPVTTMEVQRRYAVQLKGKKTEYEPSITEDQDCVNSLFPHLGDVPCWYLARHTRQQVDLNSAPASPIINPP